MVVIGITNESTILSDELVRSAMKCLQAQVTADFFPAYGVLAELLWLPKGRTPVPGQWQLVFADASDQAGALGYHETTTNGDPIGYVFVKDDIQSGSSWTVTASHELLEMLGDPDITTVSEQDNSDGSITFRPKEVCDVCEDDSLAYHKTQSDGTQFRLSDGTPFLFSDFVFPHYWNPLTPSGQRLDYCGHLTTPLQILAGGYIGVLQVPKTVKWGQVQADLTPGGKTVQRLNRRARRALPDHLWKRSER